VGSVLSLVTDIHHRRLASCAHEAAHAVVFSLGGFVCTSIAVAEPGESLGLPDGSKAAGYCEMPLSLNEHFSKLEWNGTEYRPTFDAVLWKALWSKHDANKARTTFRAIMVGHLAGPVASAIFNGDSRIGYPIGDGLDFSRAVGFAKFLPYGHQEEIENAWEVTRLTLANPKVWSLILCLASTLSEAGQLRGNNLVRFLPSTKAPWPPAPKSSYYRYCELADFEPSNLAN